MYHFLNGIGVWRNADASIEVGSNCAMGGGWENLDKFRCDFG